MEYSELEKQLLIRGMHSRYITKEIIGKNVSGLLNNSVYKQIGYIIYNYYLETSVPITESALTVKLNSYFNREDTKRQRQHLSLLTEKEKNTYLSTAINLLNSTEDDNEELVAELDKYVKNKLATLAIIDEASKKTDDLSLRVAKRTQEINDLSLTGLNKEPVNLYKDLDKKKEIYEDKDNGKKVKSGLPSLDKLTGSGLRVGQLALIGGLYGNGKTSLFSNLAYYYSMVGGNNVLYISLEELPIDIITRSDRIVTGAGVTDVFNLESGKIKDTFITKTNSYLDKLNKYKHGDAYAIDSMPQTETVDSIKQMVTSLEKKKNIKIAVIIIDYADLLKVSNGYTDNEAATGEILFQKLSKLAHETNTVVWTATQLNRQAQFADVKSLQYIEGSKRKMNTVALGLTINATPEEKKEGYMRLYLDKVRNSYNYDDDFLYFKYNLKSMRLKEENDLELADHKSLVEQFLQSNRNSNAKRFSNMKKEPGQTMNDVINNTLKGENK